MSVCHGKCTYMYMYLGHNVGSGTDWIHIGSPMLFLTFTHVAVLSTRHTCTVDTCRYLRKVNHVPTNYDIGRLSTEDSTSVSRKFSLKFHAFFQTRSKVLF